MRFDATDAMQLLLHLPYEQAALEAPALAHRLALSNSVCARGACCALVAQTYSLPPLPRQLQLRVRTKMEQNIDAGRIRVKLPRDDQHGAELRRQKP